MSIKKSEEKSTIIEPENVGSSSSLSSSSVSSQLELQLCPKRALLLYKLIVNVLQKRIHAHYSKTQSFYQDINIYVFVKAYEIDYLNKHLNQLQYIIDDTLSDKLSEQSKHFCNNLDSIEKTILGLVNRMKFKDESSFQILKDGFNIGKKVLNYVLDNVPDVQEDSQAQLQNPIENRRQLLGTHGQSQSSIYNVSNMTINYIVNNYYINLGHTIIGFYRKNHHSTQI
ncbi:hypothetical protein BLOT_002629 [Blomia tropicalis]|nr:hypothetical protein BLOT_002629 [Blomia tropicalis]